MTNLKNQLIELLNIHGVSGDEGRVRNYLKPVLSELTDKVEVDLYGNLLATKKFGNGKGATVLLSAHMDTVKGVQKNRKLIENNGVITSNKGALGADDRAGIAIILTVLRNMKDIAFDGTVKISFSREEEIGCIGASQIDPKFYDDVDLAIVVDRRGNRDIVVGCGQAFCSNNVGSFMEDVAKMADMDDWKCVEGGISDAMTFSENGINSINLSAGYRHEHTDKEYVVISDMKDTTQLILQAFAVINGFYDTFGDIGHENNWVKSWYVKGSKYNKYTDYYEDEFGWGAEEVWAEEADKMGDVFIYEVEESCVIAQGENEILLSRESLRNLMNQLKDI
jgi:putative aminopeptidase FrvX